jgi:hypothetical protein
LGGYTQLVAYSNELWASIEIKSKMRKIIYYSLLIISIISIPISGFAIINTMVSLKYETDGTADCISTVTGYDLCFAISTYKWITITSIITLILLSAFKKQLLQLKRIDNDRN